MFLLNLTLSCIHSGSVPGTGTPGPEQPGDHLALPGLRDVACQPAARAPVCVALTPGGLVTVPGGAPLPSPAGLDGYDTLRAGADGGWEVEGPCASPSPVGRCVAAFPPGAATLGAPRAAPAAPALEADTPSLTAAADAFVGAWTRGAERGWRSGFQRLVVAPGGGRITWLRGVEGAGQLMRAGGGSRSIRVAATTSAASFPAWIALHPTGQEAYLVAWPSPWVRAFDPATLESRWTLPLEGGAQGLFVDADGRWLVVGVGPAVSDRLADWALPVVDPAADADPARDEVLRTLERPPMDTTIVIDLAAHTVAGEAQGQYRRLLHAGDALLIATDREIVTIQPGDLPR